MYHQNSQAHTQDCNTPGQDHQTLIPDAQPANEFANVLAAIQGFASILHTQLLYERPPDIPAIVQTLANLHRHSQLLAQLVESNYTAMKSCLPDTPI